MKTKKGARPLLVRRLNILVSAGATREPIDPVRFISNYATGLLGCEIAKEARRRGHRVILVSGALSCAQPKGIRSVNAETARQMQAALKAKFNWCDCLIMTAAVGDFRPRQIARKKIKRGAGRKIRLELRQNPDIIKGLAKAKGDKTVVGFALETEALKCNAQAKLRAKGLELIVATQVTAKSYPFGNTKLDALIIGKKGHLRTVKRTTKAALARILLDTIEKIV